MAIAWLTPTFSGLPRSFWLLWLGTFINRVGIFVAPFFTLLLTNQRGLDVETATLIVSLYGIGSFASQLLGGVLTDRLGRRMTMLISFFGTPIILLILAAMIELWHIALGTLLFGLITDLYRPASASLIADVVPEQDRPRAYSLVYWAINLGAAIGLSLAGMLARQSYVLLFISDALTTAVFGFIMLFFVPETRVNHVPVATSTAERSVAIFNIPSSERPLLNFSLLFALLTLLSACVFHQSNVTMPLDMYRKGLTEADYGFAIGLNGLFIVLLSLFMNQLLARYNHITVMAAAAVLLGLGFGMNAIATTTLGFALGIFVWTLGEMMSAPLISTIMADLAPLERRGFYQGLLGAACGLSVFVGPAMGGVIYNRISPEALWLDCLLVGLIAAAGYLVLLRPLYLRLCSALPEADLMTEHEHDCVV